MIRPNSSLGFLIFKEDFENGIVKKQTYSNDNNSWIEYWIYTHRPLDTNLYLPPSTRKKLEQETELYLSAIIVSRNNTDLLKEKILPDGRKGYYITGIKFTEKDINLYLGKTNRHSDKAGTKEHKPDAEI
jgi:hypothetical protein